MGKNPRMAHMNILLINLSNNIPPEERGRAEKCVCLRKFDELNYVSMRAKAIGENGCGTFSSPYPWDVLFITNKIIIRQRRVCLRHIRACLSVFPFSHSKERRHDITSDIRKLHKEEIAEGRETFQCVSRNKPSTKGDIKSSLSRWPEAGRLFYVMRNLLAM